MMKQLFFLVGISISVLVSISQTANAQAVPACAGQADTFTGTCSGEPTSYKMTIKGMRLRKSGGGGEFVTIGSTSTEFDFALATAGQAVGSYINGATIPNGTYDAISPVIDVNQSITANTTLTTDTCRTDTGNTAVDMRDGGTAEEYSFDTSGVFSAGSDAVEGANTSTDNQYINGDGDFVLIDSTVSGFPITVADGSSFTFTMTVDAASAANFDFTTGDCDASYPGELSVNLSVSGS